MKFKTSAIVLVWLASVGFARASTNDITTLVQKGLFEEEANHHLDVAIQYYQDAIGQFNKDRQLTATAIFRLGECYRLQGKTNEANVQYERIVQEFSDQPQLVELSRGYLPKANFVSFVVSGTNTKTEQSAAEQEEIGRIKDMIQNSPDLINRPVPQSADTPLVVAARNGWMSAAKLLVDNGASVNPGPPSITPLAVAANAGNKGMIEFLLADGANVNALDGRDGLSPLHYAVEHGFKTVTETLLAHGANVDLPSRDGQRPLYVAVSHDYMAMAEVLLAHKADINAPGKGGETALFRAIQNNFVDMVPFLISNRANVNIKSESGETPLCIALKKNDINIAIVKALLDSGADVKTSAEGDYPLDIAVSRGRVDLVELLLQNNADPNLEGRWNVTSIHNGRGELITQNVSPLILAFSRVENSDAYAKIAILLLQHSANPNLTDEAGNTPLDFAILSAKTNLVGELISHHADVNAPDKDGDPPLAYVTQFLGVRKEAGPIKEILIQAGASEDYQRCGAIFVTQKGTGSIGEKVFYKGTNSVNRYTLFELIALIYSGGGAGHPIAFPDFTHVAINRLKADGTKEEISVDLNAILQAGDCSKNPWLEWGDIVLIPQLDHNINDYWQGLTQSERGTLGKCLLRKVKVIVKGQTTQLALLPSIVRWYGVGDGGSSSSDPHLSASLTSALNGETVLYNYDLDQVVHQAHVLLISSDLSRVKVTRGEAKTGEHPLVMEFNLEPQSHPDAGRVPLRAMPRHPSATQSPADIQLLDGDVIEIPEREQGVSATK